MNCIMNKILVVDDHPIVLKGIATMLAENGYSVVTATGGEQAISLFDHIGNINLMVCDLSLPTTAEGIELIVQVREKQPQVPIIVFTMHDELWNIKAIIDIEADGIVLKGESPKELLLAIENVLNGQKHVSPQFQKMTNEVMASSGILSKKEIEIIKEISAGCKSREIAVKMCISEKAIEFHRHSILHKLGAKTIAEATRRALEMGILP